MPTPPKLYEYRGEKLTSLELIVRYHLPKKQFMRRLKDGWNVERAIEQPYAQGPVAHGVRGVNAGIRTMFVARVIENAFDDPRFWSDLNKLKEQDPKEYREFLLKTMTLCKNTIQLDGPQHSLTEYLGDTVAYDVPSGTSDTAPLPPLVEAQQVEEDEDGEEHA